jgi:hypothetical protein
MTPADPTTPALDPRTPVSPVPPAAGLLAEPTFEECVEEWNRFFDDQKAGRIDFRDILEGHYIAYYGGQIHGHDADSNALQHRVAAALGIHWARVVIHYPWMW